MKKQIMALGLGCMILNPTNLYATDCMVCMQGYTCSRLDSFGCCIGTCSNNGGCAGVQVCMDGWVFNDKTCECENGAVRFCLPGQYKVDGSSMCKMCPALSGCLTTSPGGFGGITSCEVTDCVLSDESGSYTYDQACNYSE